MGLHLFFLPNFPGATFIQGATFIPDSGVAVNFKFLAKRKNPIPLGNFQLRSTLSLERDLAIVPSFCTFPFILVIVLRKSLEMV